MKEQTPKLENAILVNVNHKNDLNKDKKNMILLQVTHKYKVIDQAEPGIKLDIAEHNKIQEKTKGMRAKDSDLVQNKKDPVGKKRRDENNLSHPRRRDGK